MSFEGFACYVCDTAWRDLKGEWTLTCPFPGGLGQLHLADHSGKVGLVGKGDEPPLHSREVGAEGRVENLRIPFF